MTTQTVQSPQSICRFAIARADITPPLGIYHRMWGAAIHDRSAGVHRPLTATAMLFQSCDAEFTKDNFQVLIALDHCLFSVKELTALLKACRESSGIDAEAIAVTFSHTHAAGLMLLDRESEPGGEMIPDYLRELNSTVASLVVKCQQELQPVTITYGFGSCNLAAHRDYFDASAEQYVCGFNPTTEADDTVVVARVTNGQDKVLATVVNYACHPTTLAWDNQMISPDYPGAMREVVEQASGAPCVFIQGACGDLGPRQGFVGDVEVADQNGRQLGFAVLSAIESLPPPQTQFNYQGPVVSGATIGTWSHVPVSKEQSVQLKQWRVRRQKVAVRYRDGLPTAQQVDAERAKLLDAEQSAKDCGDQQKARDCRAMVERKTRLFSRLKSLPAGDAFPYEVVVWRLGDSIWVSVQGEPYNFLQTELRRRFSEYAIIVASISSHWGPTYLPTADTYDKGIYQESIAVVRRGCLEQVIEAVATCIEDLMKCHIENDN